MTQHEPQPAQFLPDELRGGLSALVARLNAALAHDDPEAFAAEFLDDGAILNPTGEHARGRGNVEALMRKDLERLRPDGTSKLEIVRARQLSPTLALVDLEHHVARAVLPDGTEGPLDVHVASVVRRVDARWRVLDAHAYVFVKPPVLH
jgi:uncharacterized protein (TIGR02246 family)